MEQVIVTLVESISAPVKAGWAILLLWTLVQLLWFRSARAVAIKPLAPLAPERRSWAPKPKAAPADDVDLGHTAGASSSGPYYS
jgi:hypothetical protein